ncbi:hypothetical protein V8E36_001196, partial [Tilletia maclaganii]
RSLDKDERRHLRAALAGKPAEDITSSGDEFDEDVDDSMNDFDAEAVEEDEDGEPSDGHRRTGKAAQTKKGDSDDQGGYEEDSRSGSKTLQYFKLLGSRVVEKSARRTKKTYKEVDERWQCLLCGRNYTAHPTNRSNLALHLNFKSNLNHCKRMFDPIDKRFVGHFEPPKDSSSKRQQAVTYASPASQALSTPTNAIARLSGGAQKSLDGWVAATTAQKLQTKVVEVRGRIPEWLVLDNQPFTEPTRP